MGVKIRNDLVRAMLRYGSMSEVMFELLFNDLKGNDYGYKVV